MVSRHNDTCLRTFSFHRSWMVFSLCCLPAACRFVRRAWTLQQLQSAEAQVGGEVPRSQPPPTGHDSQSLSGSSHSGQSGSLPTGQAGETATHSHHPPGADMSSSYTASDGRHVPSSSTDSSSDVISPLQSPLQGRAAEGKADLSSPSAFDHSDSSTHSSLPPTAPSESKGDFPTVALSSGITSSPPGAVTASSTDSDGHAGLSSQADALMSPPSEPSRAYNVAPDGTQSLPSSPPSATSTNVQIPAQAGLMAGQQTGNLPRNTRRPHRHVPHTTSPLVLSSGPVYHPAHGSSALAPRQVGLQSIASPLLASSYSAMSVSTVLAGHGGQMYTTTTERSTVLAGHVHPASGFALSPITDTSTGSAHSSRGAEAGHAALSMTTSVTSSRDVQPPMEKATDLASGRSQSTARPAAAHADIATQHSSGSSLSQYGPSSILSSSVTGGDAAPISTPQTKASSSASSQMFADSAVFSDVSSSFTQSGLARASLSADAGGAVQRDRPPPSQGLVSSSLRQPTRRTDNVGDHPSSTSSLHHSPPQQGSFRRVTFAPASTDSAAAAELVSTS